MPKRTQTPARPVVALLVETSNAFSRELLQGIRDWIRSHRSWAIHLSEQGRGNHPPEWLKHWKGHGIIARIENRDIEKAVRQAGVPVVNVSASGLAPEHPAIISDSLGIARLAAEHLMERGLRTFGYCGDARFPWSAQHGENFRQVLKASGFHCHVYPAAKGDAKNWLKEQQKMGEWLKSLPKPVGIMTCYDIRGQQLLDVCRQLRLEVPDQVAVIGQHNDEVLCDLCDPPLSSVIPGARDAGQHAAAALDALMMGKALSRRVHWMSPIGVATRQSTDFVAVEDERLKQVARFIRDHFDEKLSIDDIVQMSGMSRTLLERRFRACFGVSPYERILSLRIAKAEHLLGSTNLSIAEISDRLGFSSPEHFHSTFRKRKQITPGAMRKRAKSIEL